MNHTTPEPAGTRSQLLVVALGFTIASLTLLVYLPATDAGFYFDDLSNIVEAPAIHWQSISVDGVVDVARHARWPRRFFANVTFAMDHARAGLDPDPYHRTNVLIHLAVGVVLFLLTRKYMLYGAGRYGSRANSATTVALLTTALFLVHPLNTQAVTYVVQRMTSMAALFMLLALWLYLFARRSLSPSNSRRWLFLASAASWLAALLCKETAAALPLVIVIFEASFHRREWCVRFAKLRNNPRRRWIALLGIGLALATTAALVLTYAGGNPFSLTARMPTRDFNGIERVLTQSRVHLFYLSLLFVPAPSRLSLDHDFAVSRSPLSPLSTGPALLFWLVFLLAAVRLSRRRPRLGFPLLAYLSFHLIESAPLNLELVFEHRMYLPLAMLALLASVAVIDLPVRSRVVAMLLLGLLAAPLAALTYQRNKVWADPLTFHRDTASKAPNKFRPWYNLGTELGKAGHLIEAQRALEHALSLQPHHSECTNQLGNVFLVSGDADRALTRYEKAVQLDSENLEAWYNLGLVREGRGELALAILAYEAFAKGARSRPDLQSHEAQVRARIERMRSQLR